MIERISSKLAEFETNPCYQYGLLIAITLLASVLRFYKLGEWSFWIDEIFTINRAQAHYDSLEAIIRNIPPTQNWIPLSVILTAGVLNILGPSEWSARFVPAVIGIISIPVLYFPIKRLFSPNVSLVAVLLLAVSPWHLYWSQNARFYTSLMLLYTLALFAFFYGLERDRPGYILIFIVLLYLATSERLFASFIVPVVGCYLLLLKTVPFEKPVGLRARNLLLILLPGIAFGIFEVYSFVTTGSSIIIYGANFFVGHPNHSPWRLLIAIVYRISIPLICLGFFGGIYLLTQKRRAGFFVSSAAMVPPLMLLVIAPVAFTVDRYMFVTLPFWAILTAVAIGGMYTQAEKYGKLLPIGVLTLILATSLGQTMLYYEYQNGDRPDWKSAFAIIHQRKAMSDLVVATRPELGRYYFDDKVRSISGLDLTTIELNGNRVWFVIDEATSRVDPATQQWLQENGELINVRDVYMPGKSLSIRIYLYDPKSAQKYGGKGDIHPALESRKE